MEYKTCYEQADVFNEMTNKIYASLIIFICEDTV